MKNKILIILLLTAGFFATAQQKGSYLGIGGGAGLSGFQYGITDGNAKLGLGFHGNINYSYFFNRHWGIGTGIQIASYSTKVTLDEHFISFENQIDEVGDVYRRDIDIKQWDETQKAIFFEIPILLQFQHKFGAKQRYGMYAGLGVKVQFPMTADYSVVGNEEVQGYYDQWHVTLYDLPLHGFGEYDKGPSGDLDLKTSFALTGEVGFLRTLSRRVDLYLGVYCDYGLNTINTRTPDKDIAYIDNSGQETYQSVLTSNLAENASNLAIGGKLGIRIKLGKSPQKDTIQQPIEQPIQYIYQIWVRDSLTNQPMLADVTVSCTDCATADEHNFYSSESNAISKELQPSHTYAVTLNKAGFAPYTTQITTTFETKEHNILLPLHPQLTGLVANKNSQPIHDVSVTVIANNGKIYKALTDTLGRFNIPSVDAGVSYTVVADKHGYMSDTIKLSIPADPNQLQPSYNVVNEMGVGLQLKPIRKMVLSALVLFDLNKYDLRQEAKAELDRIIPMLKENPQITLEVGGHADSRGTAKLNQVLSQNRANSVRDYMISQGIDAKRITAKGYGFNRLVNNCKPGVQCSEAEHQDNRRVEFIFSEKTVIVK